MEQRPRSMCMRMIPLAMVITACAATAPTTVRPNPQPTTIAGPPPPSQHWKGTWQQIGTYLVFPTIDAAQESGFQLTLSLWFGVDRPDELKAEDVSAEIKAAGNSVHCPVSRLDAHNQSGDLLQFIPELEGKPLNAYGVFHCDVSITGPADVTVTLKGVGRTFAVEMPAPS